MKTALDDYNDFLRENNLTQEAMDEGLRNSVVEMSIPCDRVYVAKSLIHGNGIFAGQKFETGDFVADAYESKIGVWSVAGRYTNHSPTPNVEARKNGSVVSIVAIRPICHMNEITADYRQVKRVMEGAQ